MNKVIARHDDFDFRMPLEIYKDIHDKFIELELVETAVIQFTNEGRESDWVKKKGIVDYLNTAPNWDIQLHGWSHSEYHEMTQSEIADDLQKCLNKSTELFGKYPTVWYTPHNGRSEDMEYVAEAFGLTISNESYDISRFIRENVSGEYKGTTFYFHGWKNDEVAQLDETIKYV